MTTTIEDASLAPDGDGFLLNNQLTDFSFAPEENGKPVANRVEPANGREARWRRPSSSIASSTSSW